MTNGAPAGLYHQAAQTLKAYDEGLILGHLAWYSIPELRVEHTVVVQEMVKAGLDDILLPPVPRPSDVFKRVCTLNGRKNVIHPLPNRKSNYKLVEVGKDKEHIWRNLVREVVDTEGHVLDYTELAQFLFDRQTQKITVTPIGPGYVIATPNGDAADVVAQKITEGVKNDYHTWLTSLTAYALRELVRHVLEGLRAVTVRPSGGVYFVAQEQAERLAKLEVLINSLPGGCSFHTLPLPDDSKQREMLRHAFELESVDEVDRLLGDISEILTNGKRITPERYAQFADEYNTLRNKCLDYKKLLDDSLLMTSSRLELFQQGIVKLMDAVK